MGQILADGTDRVSCAARVERAKYDSGGHTPFDRRKL
jgi:hypothetical protein